MSKYDPLARFLREQEADTIRVSFSELEHLLGFKLPASKANRAWWSNNPNNSVMTKVWLTAGWRTRNVDIEGGRVTFYRDGRNGDDRNTSNTAGLSFSLDLDRLHPVAKKVLWVLARRSGRSPVDEAVEVLNDALAP